MVATKALITDDVNGLVFDYQSSLRDKILQLVKKNFFSAAISTARDNTIEMMVARHLEIIEEAK